MIEIRLGLGRNTGENEMAKANKDGWIRNRGKCHVEVGTLVDVKYRDGLVSYGVPALIYNTGTTQRIATEWKHSGYAWDIMQWRLSKTEPSRKEPQPMTAEQIRAQYIENLSSIAMLHTKNAALVDDLRKIGFDFYEAPEEPQEDMSDPKNWRVGDVVECVSTGGMADMTKGKKYEINSIDGKYISLIDDAGDVVNRSTDSRFKFHSRPTK